MTNKAGANLFTINFTSSSYYEEEEEVKIKPIKPPIKQPPIIKAPVIKFVPTRITKQNIAETPIEIELSDSSYYSDDDYSKEPEKVKKKQVKSTELNEDVFSIDGTDSNHDIKPTRIMKQTGNYQTSSSINHQSQDQFQSQTQYQSQTQNVQSQQSSAQEDNNNDYINKDYNNRIEPQVESQNSNNIENTNNSSEINQNNESIQTPSSPIQNSMPASASPSKISMPLNSWPIYLIKREKKMQINGRRILFTFSEGDRNIYSAKCKGNNPHHVYIKHGDNPESINSGDTADAVIMIGNEGTDFSLRKSSNSSNEIMTVRITPARTSADTARKMSIIFFEPRDGAPAKLMSKNPCLNPDGKPEHDFEGRFAIDSVKNAVLVDKAKGPSMMFIRKTGKMAIEIEVRFEHEDLWIFAIGIASFLSKVK